MVSSATAARQPRREAGSYRHRRRMCEDWRVGRAADVRAKRLRDEERARSFDTFPLKSFAGLGDLGHQGRRRLEVPVGIGDVGVPEIDAEPENVAGYPSPPPRTTSN